MKKKDFVTLVMSTIGGILFALGMCMALIEEWGAMKEGIAVGVIGIATVVPAYPIYKRITENRRKKIAPEIMRLTDELSQQ